MNSNNEILFGGLYLNHSDNRAVLEIVSLENYILKEKYWIEWNNINEDKIYNSLTKCSKAQKCQIISVNAFSTNGYFQRKLDTIPNVVPEYMTTKQNHTIFLAVDRAITYGQAQFNESSKTEKQIDYLLKHRVNTTNVIFSIPDKNTDNLLASVYAFKEGIFYIHNHYPDKLVTKSPERRSTILLKKPNKVAAT